jgi:hypothetical protein
MNLPQVIQWAFGGYARVLMSPPFTIKVPSYSVVNTTFISTIQKKSSLYTRILITVYRRGGIKKFKIFVVQILCFSSS